VEQRLPASGHPTGRFGFVFTGCPTSATGAAVTAGRRRSACLHALPDAEHIYRSMGFAEHSTALSLDVRQMGMGS
jgi:hypothetical protein